MKRLLLTIALLLVVAVAGAQVTTSSLRGVVTDNDNNPIAGAAVVAHHEPSGSTYGVCTNADGHYAQPQNHVEALAFRKVYDPFQKVFLIFHVVHLRR